VQRREALRILVERSGSLVPVADLVEVSAALLPPPPAGAAPADDQLSRIGCPHCGGDAIGRWGRANGKPRYRCATCARTFNPVTGTPLAGCLTPGAGRTRR